MKSIFFYLLFLLLFLFFAISYSQENNEILPQKSIITLDGYTGCIAAFKYSLEISQNQETVNLSYHNEAFPKMNKIVQKTIPYDEFREFWSSIVALNPMGFNDSYEGMIHTADFRGELKLEYMLSKKTFVKKIVIDGTSFEKDKKMKQFYYLIIDFLKKYL
jgi:hypothetical protein